MTLAFVSATRARWTATARARVLPLDTFLSKNDRRSLSAALNNLLASPTFASWRQGATLDVGAWLEPPQTPGMPRRTSAVIISVAHLDDEERALVLGVVLEEIVAWVRSLPGTSRLRALVVFDEVYGYLPPHPANPPTKRPLVALVKPRLAMSYLRGPMTRVELTGALATRRATLVGP